MKLNWSDEALAELSTIIFYIAKDNPRAADSLAERIYSGAEKLLLDHPLFGRTGRVNETFELVIHSSYILVYHIKNDQVKILSIRHTARLWPQKF